MMTKKDQKTEQPKKEEVVSKPSKDSLKETSLDSTSAVPQTRQWSVALLGCLGGLLVFLIIIAGFMFFAWRYAQKTLPSLQEQFDSALEERSNEEQFIQDDFFEYSLEQNKEAEDSTSK